MESPKAELTAIGAAIRAALDADSDASDQIRKARSAVVRYVTLPKPSAAHRRLSWLRPFSSHPKLVAGMLTAGVAIASLWTWMRLPISFQVEGMGPPGGGGAPGRLGDLVEATGTVPVTLRFSEGSSIQVERGGQVRVLSAESQGARVLLENGAAEIAIVHREQHGTRWNFEAGPFHVLVVGTKFRVFWNAHDQSFGVSTREGSVVVTGACLDGNRLVRAGEHVDLSCASRSLPGSASSTGERWTGAQASRANEPASVGSGITTSEPAADRTGETASGAADRQGPGDVAEAGAGGATIGGSSASSRARRWQDLLRAGRLPEAFRAAERSDFGHVCRTARASELIALADAARHLGRIDRAIEALRATRQRFAGSSEAATAAFALGRIAFDKRSAYAEATRWFTTYLHEQPSGPLMGDAVGRVMESRSRQGDRQGARADAQRYLLRFPEGPYAARAREILSE